MIKPLSDTRLLWLIMGAGFLLRLALWFALPNVAHNDESMQGFEQAYRLLTGHGLVPWEYQIGARSWLLPGLMAPLMAVPMALSSSPEIAINFVHAVAAAFSCVTIWAAYRIARPFGRSSALWAAGLNAMWGENLYFGPHAAVDSFAAILLIAALAIGLAGDPERGRPGRWALAGLLFGLDFVFRVQLAPAIAVAIFGLCGLRIARLIPLSLGFAVPVLALGLLDWASWGVPFGSVYTYVLANSTGVSQAYGVEPWWYYLWYQTRGWTIGIPLLAITAWLGATRLLLPALVALTVLLTFNLVGHKEYRFIYPAIPLLITLCGIGSARLLERLRVGPAALRPMLLAGAWLLCSAAVSISPEMRNLFQRERGTFQALRSVNNDPAACGLGIDGTNWARTGYFHLRADMSLFQVTPETLAQEKPAFNYIIAFRNRQAAPLYTAQGYDLLFCTEGNINCVFKRPGPCDAKPGAPLQALTDPDAKAALERQGFKVY